MFRFLCKHFFFPIKNKSVFRGQEIIHKYLNGQKKLNLPNMYIGVAD